MKLALMLGSLAVGLVLMVAFEHPFTRVLGAAVPVRLPRRRRVPDRRPVFLGRDEEDMQEEHGNPR